MLKEIFKPIVGFEELYEISNLGRVYSIRASKFLKPMKYRGGYIEVMLRKPREKKKHCKIHRLVAEHFIDNPNNYPQVNHKDLNKLNNSMDNLEWCDSSYNAKYNHVSKLTKTNWRSVAIRFKGGNIISIHHSIADAARCYGVSPECMLARAYRGGWSFFEIINGDKYLNFIKK
jgi:NUMOD4 motif/HNH endonuclease